MSVPNIHQSSSFLSIIIAIIIAVIIIIIIIIVVIIIIIITIIIIIIMILLLLLLLLFSENKPVKDRLAHKYLGKTAGCFLTLTFNERYFRHLFRRVRHANYTATAANILQNNKVGKPNKNQS